ncbi:MAG TPA: hypothetical protein VE871_00830 [Longimicrobium sp.]|nr:hypothetical protein [Longimicrobium sp.]
MTWSASAALRFVGGGVLVLAAAYGVSEAVDPVAPALQARVALFSERKPIVEAVAVGNSHGGVLEFPELGVQGMHFSAAGQDAFEAAYLARYAAERAPRLRYVLFATWYGVQWNDHAVPGSTDLRGRRRHLYVRTPLQGPIPGDLDLWFTGMLAPVVRDDHWRGVARRLLRPGAGIRLTADGRTIVPETPPLTPDSLRRHGAAVGAAHRALGEEIAARAPRTPARVAAALDALARDLRARNVALVLYTPPYHESYRATHDPAVLAETRAILERIVAEHPNAMWLDYYADPRFAARDDLFSNSDHLNRTGGRVFSRLLGACIRSARPRTGAPPETGGCPAAGAPVASARPHAPGAAAPTPSRTAAEEPQ